MPENSCIMQLWAEPSENGSARLNLFTNLISVFSVYTKLETDSLAVLVSQFNKFSETV
mgnify:CR=1 FL=1